MINYDQIDDEVTRLVNAISQGGGGGGSTVSVVSKRNTGENIADITVNGATTQLYAPDSASDISFDPTVKGVYSGTNTQSVVDEITDDITSLNDTITTLNSVQFVSTVVYSVGAYGSTPYSVSFSPVEGATQYVALLIDGGNMICSINISGTTISGNALNTDNSSAHSSTLKFVVLAFA